MPSALSGTCSALADGDADAAVPAPFGRSTALHNAAGGDDPGTVSELLHARADVNAKGGWGCAFAVGAVRRVVGWGRR